MQHHYNLFFDTNHQLTSDIGLTLSLRLQHSIETKSNLLRMNRNARRLLDDHLIRAEADALGSQIATMGIRRPTTLRRCHLASLFLDRDRDRAPDDPFEFL